MVLVALEGVELQAAKLGFGAVEPPAVLRDLLQEERIGTVENREIEFPAGEQRVKIVFQVSVLPQRERRGVQENAEIHVAPLVHPSADGRSELQQKPDAVPLRDLLEIDPRHGVDYTGAHAGFVPIVRASAP